MNRRAFIQKKAVLGTALLLPAHTLFVQDHQQVVNALSSYSQRMAVSVAGRQVHIIAAIDDLQAFINPVIRAKALPYPKIRAEGNILSFSFRGTEYRLENVMAPEFEDAAHSAPHATPFSPVV